MLAAMLTLAHALLPLALVSAAPAQPAAASPPEAPPVTSKQLPWSPKTQKDTDEFNQAVRSLNSELPTPALEGLQRILKRDPSCAPCRYGIARARLLQNKPDEAYKLFRELSEEHKDRPFLLTEMAWAAFSAQRFGAAKSAAELAVARMPDDADALRILVRTLVRTGEVEHAQRMINVVRKHHEASFVACLEVTLHAEAKRFQEARQALGKCRQDDDLRLVAAAEHHLASVSGTSEGIVTDASKELAQRSVTQVVTEAIALYRDNRHADAKKKLVPYVKRFPDDLYARGVLGLVRYELKEYPQAKVDLEACLKGGTWIDTDFDGSISGILTHSAEQQLQQNLQRFATSLTLLYLKDNDAKQARGALDRARAFYGPSPELANAEARFHHALGKKELAWVTLQKGVDAFGPHRLLLLAVADLTRDDDTAPEELKKALERSNDWLLLYNLAIDAQHKDDWPSCVSRARAARDVATGDKATQSDALLLHCAVEARDGTTVDALLKKPEVVKKKADSVLRHAWFLSEEGNPRGALNAALALPDDGELRTRRRAAAARYHADLGELDEAKALLEGKGADKEALYHVGVVLHNADRAAEAKALFKRACQRPPESLVEACKDI